MKKSKKSSIIFNIVSTILTVVFLLSLTVFSYFLIKLNVVPNKYLIIGYSICLILVITLLLMVFNKINKVIKVLGLTIMLIVSSIFSYATIYLNNTYSFFNKTQVDYDIVKYSVIVLKDSNYKKITDLKNKTISYLDDNYKGDVKKSLKEKIKYKEKLTEEFGMLPDYLLNLEADAICLEEGYFNLIKEEVKGFEDETRVIYTFDVRVNSHKEVNNNIDITVDPFILYISGIDQYGGVSTSRGRSDVNMLAIINPKTHHILLVNTPRDYYVQLAGTTGLKDKLTHAGFYGIDKSIQTLENFYEVDINHYIKVNFNTLISIVDVIGGIDIYSDASFRPWTDKSVYVNEGWNHFNGKQALAYSRERMSYLNGDIHRGENQQQVITAILEKVSNSKVIISKYNSILKSLSDSFQTDMQPSMITSLIKYQLDKMPSWKVESIGVKGYDRMDYTYSMGSNWLLYVMEPDYNSVMTAKEKIKEVLNES